MNGRDKEALRDWDAFKLNIFKATPVDLNESPIIQDERKNKLLTNEVEFCKYYFPHYCQSDFAPFHKRFLKDILNNKRTYITRRWSRAHAKSVVAGVLAPVLLMCKGELKNMIMASRSWDNAAELLRALIAELETNQRLIHDFGPFASMDAWEQGRWVTINGCSFRAIGAGQSPRGTRNNEQRPQYILCDDLDDDEVCRNPKRLDQMWDWMTGALFGCFDIVGPGRFVVVNNVIAKDCLILRASAVSDSDEQIDILEKHKVDETEVRRIKKIYTAETDGKKKKIWELALGYAKAGMRASWYSRYALYDVAYMVHKMGYRLSQREYFNNPVSDGKVFLKSYIQFKNLPALSEYKYPLIAYLDPGFKKSKHSDSKSLILVGIHNGEWHIRKVFCGQATVEEMIGWGYAMDKFVKSNNGAYLFKMEEVFLQDLLYKDFAAAGRNKGYTLPVSGDTRRKPDKDSRIEAIAGYFERGEVFFSSELKSEHHALNLLEQLYAFEPGVNSLKDGPDALEGGMFCLQQTIHARATVTIGTRHKNTKRI
jgi:hypothetical protein